MTDSIVRNSDPTAAIADLIMVTEPDFEHEVEHLLHPQLDGDGHVVVWRQVKLRRGRLGLLFPTLAAANAAIVLLSTAYSFTWTAADTAASITFVVAPGTLRPRQTVDGWLVETPFQAV